MNKKLLHITTIILIISILTPSIIPVIAKPSPKYEKKVIIHYKKGYGKPPGTPGKGPDKDEPDEDGSYVLLAKGAKWKTTENIILDNSFSGGLDSEFFKSVFIISAQTWQNNCSTSLYTYIDFGECDGVLNQEAPDNKNEIMFGDYPEDGVIAVTIIWGIFGGPPKNREIVEFDMLFDTQFTWGDATDNPSLMDFQNIATHELGHGFGLGDLYDPSDNEETMYGYASNGETNKRDLYFGDVAGIQSLYGAP